MIKSRVLKNILAVLVLVVAAGVVAAQSSTSGGKIVETRDGIVFQKNTPTPRPAPTARPDRGAKAGAPGVPAVAPPPSGPSGPAIVNAAFMTLRGTAVRIEKGAAITIVDARTGKERRVPLAKSAFVAEGLKAGDAVTVRIPFDEGSDARTADRVDVQKTPAEAQPKSKFAQAQAPLSR